MFFFYLCRSKKNSDYVQREAKDQCLEVNNYFDIHCRLEPFDDVLPTGFLSILWSFAESIDYIEPFKHFLNVNMKEVYYTNIDRIKTLIASIAVGCKCVEEINHKLLPYSAATQCCQMNKFPDQSQINRFLRRLDWYNINELDLIYEHLLRCHGLWRSYNKVDIDFDCTGLVVYGHTFELCRKGYFPKKRGSRGYQLSLVSTANIAYKEMLSMHLDPGNIHHGSRLWDAIYQVADILGDLDRIGVVRADSASGAGHDIEALIDHQMSFLIKGYSSKTAENFAKKLSYENWIPIDFFCRVADMSSQKIPNCRYCSRVIVVETISSKGRKKYSHLYTNLEHDVEELFHGYNQRQNIEALIKGNKYGLHIDNLRTRKFWGILGFLYFAIMTHNLLVLFRYHVLKGTNLENLSVAEIAQKLMDIPAKIRNQDNQMELIFPENHKLCQKFFTVND